MHFGTKNHIQKAFDKLHKVNVELIEIINELDNIID